MFVLLSIHCLNIFISVLFKKLLPKYLDCKRFLILLHKLQLYRVKLLNLYLRAFAESNTRQTLQVVDFLIKFVRNAKLQRRSSPNEIFPERYAPVGLISIIEINQ